MASASGSPDTRLELMEIEDRLHQSPGVFDFFQAVRLMQRLRPNAEGPGGFAAPDRESIHFGVHNALAFPASNIARIDWDEPVPRMYVNFLGLTGHAGVLPYSYTELIMERQRARDTGLSAFLDIFHNRLLALFYRAWEKYRLPVVYERGALRGERNDRFSGYLLSFIGLGTPGLQSRQAIGDESLLFYTGLLSLRPRSATALRSLLEDYFEVDVEVEQFVGAWHRIGKSDQCVFQEFASFSEQLGVGAVVGDEIWDQQSRIRVRIGPLPEARYLEFLPGGSAHDPLRALVKFFVNGEVEAEIELILKREDVPACELGAEGPAGARLGWYTWVKSEREFGRNPHDTVLLLN